ncbi:unnamed protein product, partial [Porites evermanni]
FQDLSSFPSTASTSQEDHESISGTTSSRKLRVTLLSSEWRSTKGGLSTINRELAIQLAKHPSVEVSIYLPQCSEEDKRVAACHSVTLIEAEKRPGLEPELWLSCLPKDHVVDCVIGHGAVLGRQVQIIKHHHHCKWIQVVHTAPEELGMYKGYEEHISKGEKKHQVEIELCKLADQVVAVGPKLAEAFSGYLRPCGKDQDVLNLTPGIFSEFADVKQASQERSSFSVLVFGRGDSEDFQLKGYDIAAQAIAELKDTTYKLVFVGATSGEEEKVADLLLKYGIDRSQLRVRRFNESREKLAQLFCEVDLAIMPSRTEGFGLAALEALSAGLPVLVSGNSGFGEALKKVPFGSSCVIESEDPKEWANVVKAVRQKDREMRLGESKVVGRAYAEKYIWEEQCDKLIERMKIITLEGLDNSVVVELLKAEYKRRSQLRPLLWDSTIELPLENVYTRLKIISRGKLESGNDEVNVTQIFKILEKGKDVMTLVEGSPGIGKTTFCLRLAYDSTHGKIPTECSFPKFEVALLLKCRDIDGNIMDTIRKQLLPRDIEEKIVEKLLFFLKDIHNQERILIILDGLDELPEKSRHHVDELLHRRIFPFCYVLATSRQERGIEVRKNFVFDIHLEIKGYTESDAIVYVRRHFKTIGQSPKGERLIEEMQQNTFLNALQNNPLNLLLLCVVYEDYEGKLPTSRTELYQVIVRCLLRRYCAKRNLPAPEDDSVLEKTFEKEILALGEIAWFCLLNDRYGFRETELDEFERQYPGLVARELGLLYKEESLKRLKPQHEYCFLHKTFQEYVAAAYIAEKLVNRQFNVFEDISFFDLVTKYPQVFIFVSGMLGEKATVLFTQIGEELKKNDWDWNCYNHCSEEGATFFIESFNESGHPEQTAASLCKIIPFPKVITVESDKDYNASFVEVLMACKSFSNLQTPVELHADTCSLEEVVNGVLDYIESCPQLTIVSVVYDEESLMSFDRDRLCKWFSATKTLSEFTLKVRYYFNPAEGDLLVQIGHGLASCRTLTKATFSLSGYAYSEGFFNALETGLAPLTSVGLEVHGSMKYTTTPALQNFLSNKSLNSVSLCIVGGVQDLLVAAVSEALARQTVLKSLDLHFGGPLSSSSASFLEKGLMENSSLNYIRLCVHSELPGNWHSVVENLRLAKKSPVCCCIYPNTFNNVVNNYFHSVLVRKGLNVKQHLTVNVWGEMKCEAAEALCEVLAPSSITVLTLNVRGNLTSEISNSIARCLEENKTLSSLSIYLWGELTTEEGIVPSSLSKNSRVQLNVHDVGCLGDALAENPSLTTLDLTVNSCVVDADLGENLGNSLLQSSSLTSLSLTFNFSNMKEGWESKLGERLIKMASLTTLSLEINGDGEWNQKDSLSRTLRSLDYVKENQENGLSLNWSVSTLTLTVTAAADETGYISQLFNFDHGLSVNTSITTLNVTINEYGDGESFIPLFLRRFGVFSGLANNTSVTTFNLTLNSSRDVTDDWSTGLPVVLMKNKSLTTLRLKVNNHCATGESRLHDFSKLLIVSRSLSLLELDVSFYGKESGCHKVLIQ